VSRFVLAVLVCLTASTTLAGPACNPPASGLAFDQWQGICAAEIDEAYRIYGNGRDRAGFVDWLYGLYQRAADYNMPDPDGPNYLCTEGETTCGSEGWVSTCQNGQWLTGSVKCGG
jgi:hypothetical protein